MNELVASMEDIPQEIREAAQQLDYTSGIIISIGLNCQNVSPELWFYIYDEDIHPARVYAPNISLHSMCRTAVALCRRKYIFPARNRCPKQWKS